MKKIISFILLLVVLASLFTPTSLAVGQKDTPNYQVIFEKYLESDGAYAEMYSEDVFKAYTENPIFFFEALNEYSEDDKVKIAYALIHWQTDEPDALTEDLNRVKKNNPDCANTIATVQEVINKRESRDTTQKVLTAVKPARKNGFSKKIIRGFIDNNNTLYDTEFFELMAASYQVDPTLFVNTITPMGQEVVQHLARGISYGMAIGKNPKLCSTRMENEPLPLSANELAVMEQIEHEIASSEFTSILEFPVLEQSGSKMPALIPKVVDIRYTKEQATVGVPCVLEFTLEEKENPNVGRDYIVEIYTKQSEIEYLKDRFSITIPVGETKAQIQKEISFLRPTSAETSIKVYSPDSPSILTLANSAEALEVSGAWHIDVFLGDRAYGYRDYPIWSVQTWRPNGMGGLFIDQVLGKSESGDSPLVKYGDTPTGYYTGYIGPKQSSSYSYGPYKVIMMDGTYGDIVTSGRSGIWIHGGDPSRNPNSTTYPLRVTYGCIRLSNDNQLSLINEIQGYIDEGADRIGEIAVNESVE